MNPNNCGSREACQRLVEAGIVLETDCYWVKISDIQWIILPRDNITFSDITNGIAIPAPSMGEVWRELPYGISYINRQDGGDMAWINASPEFKNTNPTDALIDLRIWLSDGE